MDFKQIGLGVALTAMAFSVAATPQYLDSTTSDGNLALDKGAGYYIWNDANNTSDWSIRWTGAGAEETPIDWFGSLLFENDSLGTRTEVSFEPNDEDISDIDFPGVNGISWTNLTDNVAGHYDGIDFTLEKNYELLQFALGSSLFAELDVASNDPGVESTGIYIGENYNSPNVLVLEDDDNNGKLQQFEVPVPEPGTLALLGLGLLGLGAARRRQS